MSDPRAAVTIPPPLPAEPTAEYVAGGLLWSKTAGQTLPWAFDDITADFGDDIYERMLFDPQVRACINVLRTTVVADGVQVVGCLDDDAADGYDQAQELRAFCESALADMATPTDDVVWDLLGALAFGSRIAEEVYRPEGSYLTLHALKVKPRRSCAFVVDAYLNVLGIAGRLPGYGMPGLATIGSLASAPTVLPREKFAVLTFRPENGDPRGTSLLRASYGFWWTKQQIPGEWLKFLAAHAVPTIIGKAKGGKVQQADGTSIDRATALLNTLLSLRNNSAAVIGLDDAIEALSVPEGASQFIESLDACDRQITTGILSQTLATMEGKHQARAASQEHGTVLDQAINQIRRAVAGTLRRDVLRPLVVTNFGERMAALTPKLQIGGSESPDIGALMNGIANLARANYLHASQQPGIDQMLGLPPRTALSDDPDARTATPPPAPGAPAEEDA